MKKFNDRDYSERKEIVQLITNWLKPYTHKVVLRVLERQEEIINDEQTMNLLRELYIRDKKADKELYDRMFLLMEDYEENKVYDSNYLCELHADSNFVRDMLYDMYIK